MPKPSRLVVHIDPYQAAAIAGLHYSSPEGSGFQRVRVGRGFKLVDASGGRVKDKDLVGRVRSLVIPPAWANVWINADPAGHIQAVGWDAKGRKQYRYHPLYREVRDFAKFDRLIAFGRVLPSIRETVCADLALRGLPQRKVVAVVVRLLETTCIRVGNEEYERLNGSFGLTTLKSRHVTIEGSALRFRFRGKSGQSHDILMRDTRLARIVRECQCIPGYELFQYKDENGEVHSVSSEDVNAYLSDTTEGNFTAKDFRTWAGTCAAAECLRQREPASTKAELKRIISAVVKEVAQRLGNRPATCRKYYIHPVVFKAFETGTLFEAFAAVQTTSAGQDALSCSELAVMRVLESEPTLLPKSVTSAVRRKVARAVSTKRVAVSVHVKTRSVATPTAK
jgi:DNA topoisomerase-1